MNIKFNILHRSALIVMMAYAGGVQAEGPQVITIGKGSGILWEGLSFSANLSGSLNNAALYPQYGLLSVSNSGAVCMSTADLKTIAGYPALEISRGIGLLPRVTGTATYYLYNGTLANLKGTIGLDKTEGVGANNEKVTSPKDFSWCLPPSMTEKKSFYSVSKNRTANFLGTWVLVADGTQTNTEVKLPPMYAGSYSATSKGDQRQEILPASITLRISTLDCTVSTPRTINFGSVNRNTKVNTELAKLSSSFVTTCGQTSNFINANINVQFRAISGLYENSPARLALNQGGGFITGEIDDGVSGSGACNSTTGIPFDNTQLKLGSITSTQTSQTFSRQVTWRLCSGGTSLPTGAVTASTEMLVTFN